VAKRKAKPEIARKSRTRHAPLKLTLMGGSDGVPVELKGRGRFDAKASWLTLEVGVARSLLIFDPALVVISLLDLLARAVLGRRLGPESDAVSPVYVRSRTDLYDENGQDAGGWRVVAVLSRSHGGLHFDGQLIDCHQRIEPGERIVAVDAPWAAIAQPLAPESVLLAGAWYARTGCGNGYRGVTTTVVDWWPWPWGKSTAVRIGFDGTKIRRFEDGPPQQSVGFDASLTKMPLAQLRN
jgi:hypothetical protein